MHLRRTKTRSAACLLLLLSPLASACEEDLRVGYQDALASRAILVAKVVDVDMDGHGPAREPVVSLSTQDVLKGRVRAEFRHTVRCGDSFIFKPGDRAILVTNPDGGARLTDPRRHPEYERELRSALARMREPVGSIEAGLMVKP